MTACGATLGRAPFRRAPFTLGVEISKRFGHEHAGGYFLPVIHRNTTIPVSRVERVNTGLPGERDEPSYQLRC